MQHKKTFIITFLLPLFVGNLAYSLSKAGELNKIAKTINNLKTNIASTRGKQSRAEQDLRNNEIALGKLATNLKITRQKLINQQKQLQNLYANRIEYKKSLINQQYNLIEQARFAYLFGKVGPFKLLLNQQDPNKVNRMFLYYRYLQKYRIQKIGSLKYTLVQIQKNEHDIRRQKQKLLLFEKQKTIELNKLQQAKRQRVKILENINNELKTQQEKLAKFSADRKALEKIIAKLKAEENYFANPMIKSRNLAWPTNGRLENLYGKQIKNSSLTWSGVIIDAPEGQDVHAVSSGEVVFSQWLRGYGLLLIIDHGHGYMSLYGRNESLYKKAGDIVHKGDVIAGVGNTGGYKKFGLYFAIRHDGKAINPKMWCKN